MSIYNLNMKRILKETDSEGNTPAFYILVSTGRGVGKTYSVVRYLFEYAIKTDRKFIILTRTKGSLGGVAEGMFKAYLEDNYPQGILTETNKMHSTYATIDFQFDIESEKINIGYVLPLNGATSIKNISSTFVDADFVYLDEFIPEFTTEGIPYEFEKLDSIMGSIMRGGGTSARHVPVILTANAIRIYNPYFIALGLVGKIQPETKIFRSPGLFYQRIENKVIKEQQQLSAYGKATAHNSNSNFNREEFSSDELSAICKPDGWGHSEYRLTLIVNGKKYAIRYYPNVRIMYVDSNVDETFKVVYRLDDSGNIDVPKLKSSYLWDWVETRLKRGEGRFSDYVARSIFYDI